MARPRDVLLILLCGACEVHGAAPHEGEASSASSPPETTGFVAPLLTSAAASPPECTPACSAIERCEQARCEPACPAGEVFVPATPKQGFSMGMGEQTQQYMKGLRLPPGVKAFDTPHRVLLSKPFCMDALEVVAKDYDACVAKGDCTGTKIAMWTTGGGRHPTLPVNNVDWKQSRAYCKSLGKDLPTEAQWEWAARGDDGRAFPWGNDPATCEHADFTPGVLEAPAADTGCNGGNASVGGSHPKGDHVWPVGRIHDLAGNVWEWTLDNTAPYTTDAISVDPLVVTDVDKTHMVRGGGWNRSEVGIKAAYRGSAIVGYQRPGLGFRCVRNPGAVRH